MLFKLADFKFIPLPHLHTCTWQTFTVMLYHRQCNKLDVGTQAHGLMLVGTERFLEVTLVQFTSILQMINQNKEIWLFCKIKFIKYLLKTDLKIIMSEKIHYINNAIKIESQHHQILWLRRISSVQSLSCVRLFVTPWTAPRQASLSITNSRSSPKPISIESVMPSNHLILCRPLLLLPSIFPSIRVFSNESALHIRCPKYWSFSFNISPSNDTIKTTMK